MRSLSLLTQFSALSQHFIGLRAAAQRDIANNQARPGITPDTLRSGYHQGSAAICRHFKLMVFHEYLPIFYSLGYLISLSISYQCLKHKAAILLLTSLGVKRWQTMHLPLIFFAQISTYSHAEQPRLGAFCEGADIFIPC